MNYRAMMASLVAASAAVACGLSTSSPVGPLPSSSSIVPSATSGAPVVPAPPASPRAGPVFSGVIMLGQRSIDSNSEDDPAAYHYRLQYSLDQIDSQETVDLGDRPGLFRTRVTTSATVLITNMTPGRRVPLIDLRGVILGGGYKFDRGICHQRNIPIAVRGDYCFVGFWSSPDGPDDLAVGETRQLGNSSPMRWEIPSLVKEKKDALMKDLLSPDLYFVASMGYGYHLVPKNRCTISFDLSSGHAIIDTRPRINVCAEG